MIISKVDNFEILDNKNKYTQTELSSLFIKENEDNKEQNIQKIKQRKNDTDLIRNKLFIYFNNMLYNWIKISINNNDNVHVIPYHFKIINKKNILSIINKNLYELFVHEYDCKIIDTMQNELLKEKLKCKYKTIYDYFITEKNSIGLLQKNQDFWTNFKFLEDYLEELKEKENDIYINRMKVISLEYNKWLNEKVHLFKNNENT